MAAFWYMGGAGVERFPFNLLPNDLAKSLTDKSWRRLGAPIATLVYGLLMTHWWEAPIAAGLLWVGALLPITLIGNNVWKNWWWHPIHGLIYGSTALAMSLLSGWLWGLIACGVVAILYATWVLLFSWIGDRNQSLDWWGVQELFTPATIAGAIITVGQPGIKAVLTLMPQLRI